MATSRGKRIENRDQRIEGREWRRAGSFRADEM
jgi:hypothetical protein